MALSGYAMHPPVALSPSHATAAIVSLTSTTDFSLEGRRPVDRMTPTTTTGTSMPSSQAARTRFLLLVAGLGGLLYGVDVGIIGGALPYLEATSHLNAGQLSIIVAAVLL